MRLSHAAEVQEGIRVEVVDCSNEPEICDFMTNNLKGGDLPILKCDCCKDGYLIVKEGWGEPFLGCTNFRADRSGCNRAISRDKYLRSVKPLFDE